MKAKIDQENCIGCSLCVGTCPDVFRMNEANIAEVYGEVTPENEASAFEAESTCPVNVISFE